MENAPVILNVLERRCVALVEVTSIKTFYKALIEYGFYKGVTSENWKAMQQTGLENVYFRGQEFKYPSIICGLPREKGFVKNENEMYCETLQTKKADFAAFANPIEYLSKMQHYGMPTRLIDFTINPLIALFFAVQKFDNADDVAVYVYRENGRSITDITVKILSVLPTVKLKDTLSIQKAVQAAYELDVDEQEIIAAIGQVTFIKYSDSLKATNPRLYNQSGTFAICGNKVVEGKITEQVCNLELGCAALAIRIAQEYKFNIKQELDTYFGINDNFIYPEFTEWAKYIYLKYKPADFSPTDSYHILSNKDISLPEVKRYELKIVLNKKLNSEEIEKVIADSVKKYKKRNCVVWFYVANSNENYIIANWIYRGYWVAENIPEYFSPVPLESLAENRFYWEKGASPATMQEYAQKELFRDDKELFVSYFYLYQLLSKEFHALSNGYEILDYEVFCDEVEKRAHFIIRVNEKMYTLGRSKENGFDEYLLCFLNFSIALLDIVLWARLEDKSENWLDYRINRSFSQMHEAMIKITRDKQKWMGSLGVKPKEISQSAFKKIQKTSLGFGQSVPVSENALEVYFRLGYHFNADQFIIEGESNLYDDAKVCLTLKVKHAKGLTQAETLIKDGCFRFEMDKCLMTYENYTACITVAYPRTQKAEFLDKAGNEYENLKGSVVQRGGIHSTIYYAENFEKSKIDFNE